MSGDHDDTTATDDEREHEHYCALLPELAPPADFATRVLREHARRTTTSRPSPSSPRRWRPLLVAAATGALAASLLWSMPRVLPTTRPAGTIATLNDRQQIDVDGAHITLLPNSSLDLDNGIAVTAGEAFFRVEPHDSAAPFVVTTPNGDVVVTGTCFSVSLKESTMLAHHHPRSLAVGAALGAALGIVVTVAVHEGTVTLKNPHGEVQLQAGEHGTLTASNAPSASPSASMALQDAERRLATVLSTVQATEAAVAGDTRALVDENARLRALVDKRDEELALLDVERKDREGEPLPFPKDLPARFTEKELLSSLTTALKEAGIKGDITAIDCAEYPCMVWGEAHLDTSELTEQLAKSSAFAAYADDGKHVRGWGSGEGNSELFAITLTPRDPNRSDEEKAQLDKRTQARAEAAFEANKPASWAANK